MVALDANTRVSIGSLAALLVLGAGGIWKVAGITSSIEVGNAKLANIEAKVGELTDSMKGVVPLTVFDLWKSAQEARDRGQDSRMDRFDRLIDGEHTAGGK